MPRLKHPPVVHVLAQVVHTPVLAFGEHIAEIQSRFLAAGYPFFSRQEMVQIYVDLASGGAPRMVPAPRWDFVDKERTRSVSLTENSLVVSTRRYARFETFSHLVNEALGFVNEFARGSVVERIGLRYVDYVRPKTGEQLLQYLKPGLLGFDLDEIPVKQGRSRSFRTEALAETDLGQLAVRCYRLPPGQMLPPDLVGGAPLGELAYEPVGDTQPGVVLDFDHFSQQSRDFSPFEILNTLQDLQGTLGIAFRRAITDYAWEAWTPMEAE